MDTKLLSDHKLIIYILGQMIKRLCNCPLIYESQTLNQEKYPFFTYNFISLEEDLTFDWQKEHQPYKAQFQVDAYSDNPLDAEELILKLWEGLKSSQYRIFFTQADITPQTLGNTSNRTALVTGNYQYRFGFDVTFSLLRGVAKDVNQLNFDGQDLTIESISTKEEED
ncbi:hypothetical protein [Lactobacillus sp.]|uniref:phage neck terminator protein n=1 Tax=Lactobacillus sp. TaxID=1591 RepID=UPI0019B7CB50|nr:hypothetical protein [Lactobacillus sp.]MBD5430141.1 hypothetical protein [Lactobacillus sp.]